MSDIAELLETDEKLENSSNSSDDEVVDNESDEVLGDDETAEPADEIVSGFLSLALVKEYCRIIGDAEDELLKLLIASARDEFESYTQRNLDSFNGDIPANVIKWGLAMVADAFENRGVYKKDLFFALDRYRKSPLRLDVDEKDKLKAQLKAQEKLINALMLKSIEKPPAEPEIVEPAEPETAEQAEQNLEFLAPQEQENQQAKESENEAI